MRIMAIDYGDARTGIAISDATGQLAGYTAVIQSRRPEIVAEEIARLVRTHGVEELVLGFPRNMGRHRGPAGGAVSGLCRAGGRGVGTDAGALG